MPTQSMPSNLRHHAASAPPSPKKPPAPVTSKSKVLTAPKVNGKKGAMKPKSARAVIISDDDDDIDDDIPGNDDHNGLDKDGDGGGCDEGSEPKELLAEYEKMWEQIQHERMVHAHTFLLSLHTHVEWQPARKHSHRGQDLRMQDLHVMFTPGEIKNQATKEAKKGHFCHVCM